MPVKNGGSCLVYKSFVERQSKIVLQRAGWGGGICFNSVAGSNSEVDGGGVMTSDIQLLTSVGSLSLFSFVLRCWQQNLTALGFTGGSLERWPVASAAAEGINLCPNPPPPPAWHCSELQ